MRTALRSLALLAAALPPLLLTACGKSPEETVRGTYATYDVGPGEGFPEVRRDVSDLEACGNLLRRRERAADERDDLDAVNLRHRLQMLDAEGAGAGKRNSKTARRR